jgi:hypothetical protein
VLSLYRVLASAVNLLQVTGSEAMVTIGAADRVYFGDATNNRGVGDELPASAGAGGGVHAWGVRFNSGIKNAVTAHPSQRTILQKWARGDIIGVGIEIVDAKAGLANLRYSVNNQPLGVLHEKVSFTGALTPALSLNQYVRVQCNFGERPLQHRPADFQSVHQVPAL